MRANVRTWIAGWIALALVLAWAQAAWSQQVSGDTEDRAAPVVDPVAPFFAKHCLGCHAGKEPKGEFPLDQLKREFESKETREPWLAIVEQLSGGMMPPKEKPRPSAEEIKVVVEWIRARVSAAEAAEAAANGRVVLRRLNRAEYQNTVRDLLGIDVDLKDLLPADAADSGFDNSAESLHVSSFLMASYLDAADHVLDLAVANRPQPNIQKRRLNIKDERTVKPTGSVYRHTDDGVAIFSSWVSANIQVTLWQFNTRERGKYRFRISGYGYQTDKPVTFHVLAGPLNSAAQQDLVDYFTVPAGEPKVVEFVQQMEAAQTIRIVTDGLPAKPPDVQKVGAENYKGPGLIVQWVDVEGPLLDSWPPASHRRLFGDLAQTKMPVEGQPNRVEVVSKDPIGDAERILREFTRRAFRRTVTDEDVKPFLTRVHAKLDQGYSFEEAVRVGLKAVLISPNFLFLRERVIAPGKPLDDFALASRLSYFLWSSMPDEGLLKLAEEKKLHEPAVLREQVERLLSDPKSSAFTENFAGQWLGLRAIDATLPDAMLYPEYDDILKVSMVKEVYSFFDEVLKHDLSLTNFASSDFSIINERLATHYGIPGVEGLEFRKVTLPPESHRGGVLTMAGVMKVTANGTTTSPILRGSWVLDRILGTPPPKPTVDVEAVDPDIRGATTIRTQLAKHREVGECASCHKKIDPPGFALENFDVIGGWRENYRKVGDFGPEVVNGRRVRYRLGPPVESADELPDGRKFANIDEYKQLLLADKDQLARNLAEKLLAYGTGAAPKTSDHKEIDAIIERTRAKDFGFRALVHEVVQSKTFQSK